MKKVEALIGPFELDDVKENLAAIGIHNMTVIDVRSSGGKNEAAESYLNENYAGYVIEFLPKIKIEVLVDKDKAEQVAKAILKSSHNSQMKPQVFIYDIGSIIS